MSILVNIITSRLAKRYTGLCKLYLVAQSNIKSSSLIVNEDIVRSMFLKTFSVNFNIANVRKLINWYCNTSYIRIK